MFTKDDHDFIDMLFGKLTAFVDVEELDLSENDDTICTALDFEEQCLQTNN